MTLLQPSLLSLPREMLDSILRRTGIRDLKALSEVCIVLAKISRPLRFRDTQITVQSDERCGQQLDRFATFLHSFPHIAQCIRILTIRGGRWSPRIRLNAAQMMYILTELPHLSNLRLLSLSPYATPRWRHRVHFRLSKLYVEDLEEQQTSGTHFTNFLAMFSYVDTLHLESVHIRDEHSEGGILVPACFNLHAEHIQLRSVNAQIFSFLLRNCPSTTGLASIDVDCSSATMTRTLGDALDVMGPRLAKLTIDIAGLPKAQVDNAGPEMSVDPNTIAQNLRIAQCLNLTTLHVAIGVDLRVNANNNAKTWSTLVAILRSSPPTVSTIVIEFVVNGLLEWPLRRLHWRQLTAALGTLPQLHTVLFVNRRYDGFEDAEETTIREQFSLAGGTTHLVFQRGSLGR